MDNNKTIYLIRHGQSDSNARNDISIVDPSLTEHGILQASML